MIDTWKRFWRLSGFERGVALEAAVVMSANWAGLRIAGFRRWKAALDLLADPAEPSTPAQDSLEAARAIARMQRAAARRLFFRPNCLEQSLALLWLLRTRGIEAELRLGARKQAGRFEAHAWVEQNGAALNDAEESHRHFVPFDGPLGWMEAQTP